MSEISAVSLSQQSDYQIYTKFWCRFFGRCVSENWWRVPASMATKELKDILSWEVPDRNWFEEPDGAVNISIEWDGSLMDIFTKVHINRIIGVLDGIGNCMYGEGWPPIGRFDTEEKFWVLMNLPQYSDMSER